LSGGPCRGSGGADAPSPGGRAGPDSRHNGAAANGVRGCPPSIRPDGERGEAIGNRSFIVRELRELAALGGKAFTVGGLVHVRQPQHDGTQPSSPLGGAMPDDPITGDAGVVTRHM
jgi:hypothetical protein